jgi:hypothetical protein
MLRGKSLPSIKDGVALCILAESYAVLLYPIQ